MRDYKFRQIRPDACVVEIQGLIGGAPCPGMENEYKHDDRIRQLEAWLAERRLPAATIVKKWMVSAALSSSEHARACCGVFSPGGRRSDTASFCKMATRPPLEH